MKYFSLKELCRSNVASQLGIDNTPNSEQQANMVKLVDKLLDPIREKWGKPITVNSGFRSKALNAKVGGAKNSEHMTGCAADITTGSKDGNRRLFDLIYNSTELSWRQLINENNYSWIHISYNERDNKRDVLALTK